MPASPSLPRNALGVALCAALAMAPHSAQAATGEPEGPYGSLYLQCDGQPNNRTAGIGIVSMFGFENTMRMLGYEDEEPSPQARLFGQGGVDTCSQLIDGERAEGNALRRVELILARSLHYIEVYDLVAAEADLARARAEAEAAGLTDDPYFANSTGLSFARVEAAILMRRGNLEGARSVALAAIAERPFSLSAQLAMDDLGDVLRDLSPQAEARLDALVRIAPAFLLAYTNRLQNAGRFVEAAEKTELMLAFADDFYPEGADGATITHGALAQALAGNGARADELARIARAKMESEAANTEFPRDHSRAEENLRLLDIQRKMDSGEIDTARELLTARDDWSFWRNAPLLALIDRLREDAPPEQRIGALRLSSEEWWQRARDIYVERTLSGDSLFARILPYADPDEYEDRSRRTYRLNRSRIMSQAAWDENVWTLFATGHRPSGVDSMLLHAALQARQRGHDGLQVILDPPNRSLPFDWSTALVRFVDAPEDEDANPLFLPADEVIAALEVLIPPRDEIRRRRRARRD